MAGKNPCTIDGCEKPINGRGLCITHYARWRRTGSAMPDKPVTPHPTDRVCEVEGCTAKHYGNGYCKMHYNRHRRTGDPLTIKYPFQQQPRAEDVGYSAVHQRLLRDNGHARGYNCVDCGGTAAEWSYNHACDDERLDVLMGKVIAYSTNPDNYEPRCLSCHRIHDKGRDNSA